MSLEAIERLADGSVRWCEVVEEKREAGPDEALVGACEEERDAEAEVRESVTMALGSALDEAMQPKPAKVVGHSTWRDILRGNSMKRREALAEIAIRESARK